MTSDSTSLSTAAAIVAEVTDVSHRAVIAHRLIADLQSGIDRVLAVRRQAVAELLDTGSTPEQITELLGDQFPPAYPGVLVRAEELQALRGLRDAVDALETLMLYAANTTPGQASHLGHHVQVSITTWDALMDAVGEVERVGSAEPGLE